MAAAEWNKHGNAGGWELPPRRKPIPVISHEQLMAGRNRNKGSIWDDPMVMQGGGGGTYVGSGGAQTGYGTGITYNKPQKPMSKDQKLRRFTDFVKTTGIQEPPAPGRSSPLSGYRDKPWAQNYTAAIQANQDANTGYTDSMMNDLTSAIPKDLGFGITSGDTGGGGKAWYDELWKDAKDLGIKGWGQIGIGAMNAYTGWQEAEMAKKQHALAQETFDFQKAAYQQDRQGRVLAYNTNAQNVNAWKEAQGRTDLNKLMV